jgi:fructokinase
VAVAVADTVGAGDAFTAALSMGMLAGLGLDVINTHANRVARYVCSQRGATPPLPPDLRSFCCGKL